MNDNDLIDELREGMRARSNDAEVPNGFAESARRTARRRSARRAAAAGTPLLAAAGVATVLATGAGSGSSSPRGTQAPNVIVGGAHAHDTAYIIKRVKAKVADDSRGGLVVHSYSYVSGEASSDGSLVNLGQKTLDGYGYTAPDGSVSYRNDFWNENSSGSPDVITINDLRPDATGKFDDSRTIIYPGNQTYSQDKFSGISNPNATSTLNLFSSPSAVQQALQHGQVTQDGTAVVNGRPAIALSVKVPSGSSIVYSASGAHTVSTDLTLYVDAHTYQPLRTALSFGSAPGLIVSDWVPATPGNIAQATNASIPTGYTKVDDSH